LTGDLCRSRDANRMFVNSTPRQGRKGDMPTMPALTERESEVLKLHRLGFTTRKPPALDIGVKSVETYKRRGWKNSPEHPR